MGLNSCVILVAWEIWKHRNWCVFDAVPPCTQVLVRVIKEEARLWVMVGAKKLNRLLQ